MHTINRNNYESWLMLFIDNELTAAERVALEAFAAAHPDVQDELDGLKETLLHPEEPVHMPGMERLLMPESWNEEALTRQQEQLLLMADGELPAHERDTLEAEITASPLLNKEWALLQKTLLPSEVPGEMPGKEGLYRSTPARIIPFARIVQFAAAASILGFGWFFINRQQPVIMDPREQQVVLAPQKNAELPVNSSNTAVIPSDAVGTGAELDAIEAVVVNRSTVANNPKGIRAEDNQMVEKSRNTSARESITKEARSFVPEESYNTSLAVQLPAVKYVEIDGIDAVEPPAILQPANVELTQVAVQAQPLVSYELIDPDEYDEDETISIAGARISKQRIRNVYRNITRPIARSFDRGNQDRFDVK